MSEINRQNLINSSSFTAARAVGRRISISRRARSISTRPTPNNSSKSGSKKLSQALIIKYDPITDKHVIKHDEDGKEETVALSREPFKWIVQPSVAVNQNAEKKLKESRNIKTRKKDMIGRKFEYTTKNGKIKNYEVLAYDEDSGQHKVRREFSTKVKCINMDELTSFRWRDIVWPNANKTRETNINSSKYIGVRITSKTSLWMALARNEKGGARVKHIGYFSSEKDAALAHDCYARKIGCGYDELNFKDESINEEEVERRKQGYTRYPTVTGRCKYRGVHWQKNRKRCMARFSKKGVKHINLGAFLEPKHAALAFDHEARKQGREAEVLNFPDITVTDEQIEEWSTNTDHYRFMRSGTAKSSQYRGITYQWNSTGCPWRSQVNISKVLKGLGISKGPIHLGFYDNEIQAALAFDRICRKYGVKEVGLNFPRNKPLPDVRLYDSSCHHCHKKKAIDSVATKCNHVFCRDCLINYLSEVEGCPCCQTHMTANDKSIRSVKLKTWSNKGIIGKTFLNLKKGSSMNYRSKIDDGNTGNNDEEADDSNFVDLSILDNEENNIVNEPLDMADVEDNEDGSDSLPVSRSTKVEHIPGKVKNDDEKKSKIKNISQGTKVEHIPGRVKNDDEKKRKSETKAIRQIIVMSEDESFHIASRKRAKISKNGNASKKNHTKPKASNIESVYTDTSLKKTKKRKRRGETKPNILSATVNSINNAEDLSSDTSQKRAKISNTRKMSTETVAKQYCKKETTVRVPSAKVSKNEIISNRKKQSSTKLVDGVHSEGGKELVQAPKSRIEKSLCTDTFTKQSNQNKTSKKKSETNSTSCSLAVSGNDGMDSLNVTTSQNKITKSKNATNCANIDQDKHSTSSNTFDISTLKEGDRTAFDFGNDIYFGCIEKCRTMGKTKSKWRWEVKFDDGEVYEYDRKDMLEGAMLYGSLKEKELSDPLRGEKLRKFRDDFLSRKESVLSKIPANVKAEFLQVGFAAWNNKFRPVLFLSPYDVSPGPVREKWLSEFKKCEHRQTIDQVPRVVFWFGQKKLHDAFSIVTKKDCISYEGGIKMGLGVKMEKCNKHNYDLMMKAMAKPPSKRQPFIKLKEEHEYVMGPKSDHFLFELEAEARQKLT